MKLYVYDHCPFCVKARAILGLKGISFELVILLNDDVETPTRMIGKKMAPILEHEGRYIPESMDIVAYVDGLAGRPILEGEPEVRVAEWLDAASADLYPLAMPRWGAADLAEFATPQARAGFQRNKEAIIGAFSDQLAGSGARIARMNDRLLALEDLIKSRDAVNGALSEDDIHLFAALRALSIVRGIVYPPAVDAYRMRMARRTGVDLHDPIAA